MIVGQNTLLNQYVPSFFIKDLVDGQMLRFDSTKKAFTNFSDMSLYTWGTGLGLSGNTLSVNLGAGITDLPTGNVGINLFDTPTGALWLTTDGTNKSTIAGAGLYLKLAANGGLAQDATGLYIASGGVDLETDIAGILSVTNGGTERDSLTDTCILIGDGTNPIELSDDLKFDSSVNLLTLGTSTFSAPAAGDFTIASTNTDSNIRIVPDGTGAVFIGSVPDDGEIKSEIGQSLIVTGDVSLSLSSNNGPVLVGLPTGPGSKVTIVGPAAGDYASGLSPNDIPNVQYVLEQIALALAQLQQ